jgi:2-methylcitrate dehydratase PrpD
MKRLTRRGLLQGAGGMLAAAALPTRFAHAATAPGAVISRLSTYMAQAGTAPLPQEALEATKQHLLDTLAAMISGSDLPPGKTAHKFARAHVGEKVATVAASDIVCGPMEAALANGMLAHSDETDDSHAPSQSHPGCSVVPASLAAGEYFGIDGNRMLRAVALGYDVGPRVTMTLGALTYQMATQRSSHQISSNFGACAAAGCAAGFNAQQMRWVLDYAAQQAAGITTWQRDTDHIEKSLVFAGFPARNGVTAALVLLAGGTGVDDTFDGPGNFLAAFQSRGDASMLVDKLGERFEITRTNIKKWTVGSPIQAPLDAMENIRKRHPFEADQVQKVIVRLGPSDANTVNNREMPDICLQHMIAVMMIDKTASFAAAHDKPRMQDPAVLKQRAKVELVFDEELGKLNPLRVGVVEITFTDGKRETDRVADVRGTAENPMTREEVVTKARDLVTPFLGAAKTAKLIDTVLNLESVKNIRELRPLLQRV